MKIVLTNEIGNVIIISGISYPVQHKCKEYTEIKLQMIGPTSETEWMITKDEAKSLKIVLDSLF